MKNILLVKPYSQYNAICNYVDEIASSMRKLGCNTYIFDARSDSYQEQFEYIMSNCEFDVIMNMNGCLFEDEFYYKKISSKAIHGIYICDHPKSLSLRLRKADKRTIVFCCDNQFCNYMDYFLPMVEHKKFIALSGTSYQEEMPYEQRELDLIFTGTYKEPNKIKQQEMLRFHGALAKFVEDMLDDILINTEHTIPETLSVILKKYSQSVSDNEFDELLSEFWWIDQYVRFYFRDKLVRTVLNAGLKLHVFGNGWEDFQSDYKENLIIHQGGAYAASKALANSKIALNIMPWFKDGFQERIASAMLSKTVVFTDESKYIIENFKDGEELLLYSLKDMESIVAHVQYLLGHPQEASQIAEKGYQKIQDHTWFSRTYDMLRKMETDFCVSLIQDGIGRELEPEIGFPNVKTMIVDAVYELQNIIDLAENDVGRVEKISFAEIEYLSRKLKEFLYKFSPYLDCIDINRFIKESFHNQQEEVLQNLPGLFCLQCKAIMGELLLLEKGLGK